MSVDESDERLARLNWSREERMAVITAIQQTGVRIPTLCLSVHRRYPFGSRDAATREQARTIMLQAIRGVNGEADVDVLLADDRFAAWRQRAVEVRHFLEQVGAGAYLNALYSF